MWRSFWGSRDETNGSICRWGFLGRGDCPGICDSTTFNMFKSQGRGSPGCAVGLKCESLMMVTPPGTHIPPQTTPSAPQVPQALPQGSTDPPDPPGAHRSPRPYPRALQVPRPSLGPHMPPDHPSTPQVPRLSPRAPQTHKAPRAP